MANQRQIMIDPLSIRSLYLELFVRGKIISKATGIIVEQINKNYLVTNWHVLSGRSPKTNSVLSDTGATPDHVRIAHHMTSLGNWRFIDEPIQNADGDPLWLEHPSGRQVDIVALPLTLIDEQITIYPFDLSLADTDMIPQVAMPVSIIGFPLGFSSVGAFPIWKTGHIASDPDIDYQGIPAFLIDATTRSGMSGSPVVLRLTGGYTTRSGGGVLAGGLRTLFLGIYSGRIHEESEIGLVWRPHLIMEILEGGAQQISVK